MRIVRRASLVFSLVLIVAIVVGYAVRTSELAGDRDASLTAAADLGSVRLSSIVESVAVAATAGTDTTAAVDAVTNVNSQAGACAVTLADQTCGGNGPQPDAAMLEAALAQRTDVQGDIDRARTSVSVYDGLLTIMSTGPSLTVVLATSADIVDDRTRHSIRATTLLPLGTVAGGFADDQGLRQTAAIVASVPSVYVVATTELDVSLPAEEFRFYVIIFTLAVVLMALAGVTLFVEQRSLVERASFDTLTRLPNRGEFERRAADSIAHAERDEAGVCLLLFDLNGFKQVNDTYGHLAGDEMLKVVGNRLRRAVRDGDIVARWGGDEFVVLMPGIGTEEMGSRRALQLAEQVAGRTRLEGVADPLRVKVSVGVAIWPDHGGDLDALVVAADQAMYEAKREGVTCRVAEAVATDDVLHSLV